MTHVAFIAAVPTGAAALLRTGLFAIVVTLLALPVQARDASLTAVTGVTARSAGVIELFLALPAAEAIAAFGLPRAALENSDGVVEFGPLRNGTYEIGEAFWQGVTAEINGAPARFEAMSLMVHPKTSPLPLRDPVEGIISIGVCTVPNPENPPAIEDLLLYVGLIAYTDSPDGEIRLSLPPEATNRFMLHLRDHTDHHLTDVIDARWSHDTPLVIPAATRPVHSMMSLTALAATAAVIGLLLMLGLHLRGRSIPALIRTRRGAPEITPQPPHPKG